MAHNHSQVSRALGRKPLIFHEYPPPDSVHSLPLPWVENMSWRQIGQGSTLRAFECTLRFLWFYRAELACKYMVVMWRVFFILLRSRDFLGAEYLPVHFLAAAQ